MQIVETLLRNKEDSWLLLVLEEVFELHQAEGQKLLSGWVSGFRVYI